MEKNITIDYPTKMAQRMTTAEKKAEAAVLRVKIAFNEGVKEYYTYLRKVCNESEIHQITQMALNCL